MGGWLLRLHRTLGGYGSCTVRSYRKAETSNDFSGLHSNGLGFYREDHGIHRDREIPGAKESVQGGSRPDVLILLGYYLSVHHGRIDQCCFVDPLFVTHDHNRDFVHVYYTLPLDYLPPQ